MSRRPHMAVIGCDNDLNIVNFHFVRCANLLRFRVKCDSIYYIFASFWRLKVSKTLFYFMFSMFSSSVRLEMSNLVVSVQNKCVKNESETICVFSQLAEVCNSTSFILLFPLSEIWTLLFV